MYCNSLLPHITSPTHIIASSKTLIDNIFSNASDSTFKSGNLLTIPSDHNVQFLFPENQTKTQKGNTIVDFTAMEKQKNEINEQLPNINWAAELRLHKNNVYLSIDLLLKKTKNLIDLWAHSQPTSNTKRKSCNKPWITERIFTSITVKNKLYKKMIKTKDTIKKT